MTPASRTIIKTITTPLYTARGKHVMDKVETLFVEERQAPQPAPGQARSGRTSLQELMDATTRRGRGNPPPDPTPPPALEAAWAKLPPIARLQRYHAWKAQQPKTPA